MNRELETSTAATDPNESFIRHPLAATLNKPLPSTPVSDLTTLTLSSQTHLAEGAVHDKGRSQIPSNVTIPTSTHHKCSLMAFHGNTVSALSISLTMKTILASKEARLSAPLHDSAQNVLEMIRACQSDVRPRGIDDCKFNPS